MTGDRDEKIKVFGLDSFDLTDAHVRLLRRAYVSWDDCETGAPSVDPKRPYGNSDVAGDIREILGDDLTDEQALALHRETVRALQVVLSTGSFQPGEYAAPRYSNDWAAV